MSPINPDLWIYNTDELVRYPQCRKQSSVVWSHFKVHKFQQTKERVDMKGLLIKLGVAGTG